MTSFIKRLAAIGFAFSLAAGFGSTAFAQANSLFGNTGPTNTGTTTNRGTAVGGGLQGAPVNPANTAIGSTQFGNLGNNAGQGGFIGRNGNAGQFVGNVNAAQQTNRNRTNFRGVQGGGGNRNVQPGATGQTQLKIRPIHRVAFTFSPRTTAKMRTSLNTQFTRLAERNSRFQGLTLALNGNNEVVLRGTVKTEATRKLAAALVKLEPGVRKVKNEIVVNAGG